MTELDHINDGIVSFFKQTLYSVILRGLDILLNGITGFALSCKNTLEEMIIEDMKEIINDLLQIDNCKNDSKFL